MKSIGIIHIAIVVLACRCTNKPHQPNNNVKYVAVRNRNITINNAYSDLFTDSIAVEQFITRQKFSTKATADMRNFYNARNFEFAWFNSEGVTEQALAFRSLYDYSKDSSATRKSLDNQLDVIMNADTMSVSASDPVMLKTELMLTWRFINYTADKYTNEGSRSAALEGLVPAVKHDLLAMAAAVLAKKDDTGATNAWYEALKKQLKQYVGFARNGGWPVIMAGNKKYVKGASAPAIAQIKRRLRATGQFTQNDTTSVFTAQLQASVKAVQESYGYTSDSTITPALVRELNVPVTNRIAQVLMNMERMRWMPVRPKGRLILVNIPEYRLHVWEGETKNFDMDVVVGREGHSTVMFSGNLNQIVFSPYWNLPQSIVEKEVLPKMKRNRHYLKNNNMEITGERNGMPVVRQLPGKKNELGKVKFLFPNSYNIYFHDTPEKWIFQRDARAFSHGCIRLSDPRRMAVYLLSNMPEWTPEKMDSAMNSDKEKYVKLNDPVPVLIFYYTAWVDEHGMLQFRKDIYGHDQNLAARLFTSL